MRDARHLKGMTVVNPDQDDECPRVLIERIAKIVAFADAKRDFVLAAWLSQAQDRIRELHLGG